jgi:peptidoglycan/LPS O-acetylase OafA/YrhL
MSTPTPPNAPRLAEIDALRGVAAMMVMLFHYTTRFRQLYPGDTEASVSLPWGHLGVNLFFIISGFVIFMTLDRTRRPLDFVVSRFSRLYPVYWVAVGLTFVVVTLVGLPGKEVSPLHAALNLLMFHALGRIPHVDSVYWTLEVELLFYLGMFLLYRAGRLAQVHQAIWFMLGLRLAYYLALELWGVDLPWILFRVTILAYLPWFALGICAFQLARATDLRASRLPLCSAGAAIATLGIVDAPFKGALAFLLAGVVWLAATGRLPLLRLRPLVWLGAISYPLYLVHENIGWALQRVLLAHGVAYDLTVLAAVILSLLLAQLLHRSIELPAMTAIRQWYARRRAQPS